MDRVIANSQSTASTTVQAGVAADRISIVHPGVELPDSLADNVAVADFRAKHELGERPLLISVGRLSTRKGLREFVSHALPKIVASCPDVCLLVVGDEPRNALHADKQTIERIRLAARTAGVTSEERRLGKKDGS